MKKTWFGLVFLSSSWLWGLEYTHDAQPGWWMATVLAGVCLVRSPGALGMSRKAAWLSVCLTLPIFWFVSWPYGVGPALLILAWLCVAFPIPRDWPLRVAGHLVLAGVFLTIQAVVLQGYQAWTARLPGLPRLFQWELLGLVRLLGIESGVDAQYLALHTMRQVFKLATTWDLMLGPAGCVFLAGAAIVLCRYRTTWHHWLALAGTCLLWMPVQVAIQIAWLMQRALRTGYDDPVVMMAPFWNPWVVLSLLALWAVLMCGVFKEITIRDTGPRLAGSPMKPMVCLAGVVALLTLGLLWDPAGSRKAGHIWIDEHHSTWEPTQTPFDTEWYGHDSGYNYACVYDYANHFYSMDRLDRVIDSNTLTGCDVLVVKVPTSRYSPDEIQVIRSFVKQGGGLLLIGEHTNVFNTGTYLNDITKTFGFRFRDDCLFDIDTPFDQDVPVSSVPHPMVQHVPSMYYAVSCSIDPGMSPGRAVVQSTGLRSVPAYYHASNFYPQVEDRADSQSGAFVQLWARRYGKGRVAAFSDSTIFSNFSAFEPGKAELMLGMMEWLNHRNMPGRPHLWVLILGGVSGVWVLTRFGRGMLSDPRALAFVLSGCVLGMAAVRTLHAVSLPVPQAHTPFVKVAMDRTVCHTILPKSGFIAGDALGFGIFERWILRLGYFTQRASGPSLFDSDLVIFTYSTGDVTEAFRNQLVEYVENGGKVLVLDSPANAGSTAHSLLYPFGLSLAPVSLSPSVLRTPENWPKDISVSETFKVQGGTPLFWIQGEPVGAQATLGEGTVTVIGFGSRFADNNMGVTGDVVPDETLRKVFDLQYQLLREIMGP
ncbi:MAG: hypothetical protein HQ515_06135 [Phycisphaeraceae bacterium]|nr:hypothetical protein [Phycisphaeraceae bacterium]